MSLLQGMMGNYSEISQSEIEKRTNLLASNEHFTWGFKGIRDEILLTNKRIIFIDRQGTTGKKTSFSTIFLNSVINVEYETAGRGIDDQEINITYISSPFFKMSSGVQTETFKIEFPKGFDAFKLYRFLMDIALINQAKINHDISE